MDCKGDKTNVKPRLAGTTKENSGKGVSKTNRTNEELELMDEAATQFNYVVAFENEVENYDEQRLRDGKRDIESFRKSYLFMENKLTMRNEFLESRLREKNEQISGLCKNIETKDIENDELKCENEQLMRRCCTLEDENGSLKQIIKYLRSLKTRVGEQKEETFDDDVALKSNEELCFGNKMNRKFDDFQNKCTSCNDKLNCIIKQSMRTDQKHRDGTELCTIEEVCSKDNDKNDESIDEWYGLHDKSETLSFNGISTDTDENDQDVLYTNEEIEDNSKDEWIRFIEKLDSMAEQLRCLDEEHQDALLYTDEEHQDALLYTDEEVSTKSNDTYDSSEDELTFYNEKVEDLTDLSTDTDENGQDVESNLNEDVCRKTDTNVEYASYRSNRRDTSKRLSCTKRKTRNHAELTIKPDDTKRKVSVVLPKSSDPTRVKTCAEFEQLNEKYMCVEKDLEKVTEKLMSAEHLLSEEKTINEELCRKNIQLANERGCLRRNFNKTLETLDCMEKELEDAKIIELNELKETIKKLKKKYLALKQKQHLHYRLLRRLYVSDCRRRKPNRIYRKRHIVKTTSITNEKLIKENWS